MVHIDLAVSTLLEDIPQSENLVVAGLSQTQLGSFSLPDFNDQLMPFDGKPLWPHLEEIDKPDLLLLSRLIVLAISFMDGGGI